MKKIIIGVALLVLNSMYSQVSPLEDHIWKLESIVTIDSTLVVPNTIIFEGIFQNGDFFMFGNCTFVDGGAIYDNANMTFDVVQPSTVFQTCPNQQELMDIEQFFMEEFFFIDLNLLT